MKYGTKGMMAVDYEERINFDRLRKEREEEIKKEREKREFG